jgi:hypothetical protein
MIKTYFKRNCTQAAYQAEPIGPYSVVESGLITT